MSSISKEELKTEIQKILKDADLDNTSAKKVRLELEEKLDCDLTDRKKEVDALVMEVIDETTQDDEDGEEEEEDEEDEDNDSEEEEAPKPKARRRAKSATPSGSESDEYAPPSDGGGSDYEPDEPVRIPKGRKKAVAKSKRKFGSEDESSGEEWGGKKKTAAKRKKKRAASSDDDSDYEKPKKKRKSTGKPSGYMMPVKLSSDLADIVGADELSRGEVVKKMWAYIKENNLQDPKNKAMVKCDEKLSKIFPTKKFRGFGMAKFLKDHMNVD